MLGLSQWCLPSLVMTPLSLSGGIQEKRVKYGGDHMALRIRMLGNALRFEEIPFLLHSNWADVWDKTLQRRRGGWNPQTPSQGSDAILKLYELCTHPE